MRGPRLGGGRSNPEQDARILDCHAPLCGARNDNDGIMALLDFLKRKKTVEKAKDKKEKEIKKPAKKPEAVSARGGSASGGKVEEKKIVSKPKKTAGFSYDIVKEPHISERATNLSEQNQYVFKVFAGVNKPEIKKAVEGIYGVDVLSVNIIKIPARKRRMGKTQGFRKGFTKAVVKIKEGQKIEIL